MTYLGGGHMKFLIFTILLTVNFYANGQSLTAYNGELLDISTNTFEELKKYFDKMSSRKILPFKYLVDGCHARTQQLVDIADVYHIQMAKLVIEPKSSEDSIYYLPKNTPYRIIWSYHMAGVVYGIKDNKKDLYILDPSLFTEPVTAKVWQAEVLKDTPAEDKEKFQSYFISATTFRPDMKEKKFTKLPDPIDREMPGMVAQFRHDLKRYGSYLEKCFLVDQDGVISIGGWPVSAEDERLQSLKECFR
jgi:hypothetical protein